MTGAVLKWARESSTYTLLQAAAKLEIDAADLEEWEAGHSRPTIAKLREIANLYKRPLAVFYLREPPTTFQSIHDYRRLPSAQSRQTPELALVVRSAHLLHQNALELAGLLEQDLPAIARLSSSEATDPEKVGSRIRELLGVDSQKQASWREDYAALRGWVNAIERIGVLVSQASGVEVEELRGLSAAHEKLPVILVNSKDSPRGRIFSLLHELGHILLRHGGMCNLASNATDQDEAFCNAVAAAALMPRSTFLSDPEVERVRTPQHSWDPGSVRRLALLFTTSEEAVLRRLLTFDKITESYYKKRRAELSALIPRESGGPVPIARKRLSELGRTYVSLALEAYDREVITTSDLSDFLRLKTNQFSEIRNELRGRAA